MEEKIFEAIVLGYRKIIDQRYQYEHLEKQYELPSSIDAVMVSRIREYFLEYIYPGIERREELDAAFDSLDDYVKQPRKLMSILLDSSKLIFRYGVQLPKILGAGLKALHTFNAASKFENQLINAAIDKGLQAPFESDEIGDLIRSLPRTEIDQFIDNGKQLFATLYDRKTVKSIKEILHFLAKKMKEKQEVYSSEEIRGIELGLEMVQKGDTLFAELSDEVQKNIIDMIIQIERDALDEIYLKKPSGG